LPAIPHSLRDDRDTEITEEKLVLRPQQHIVWLDIPVDQILIVNILQRSSDLLDIRDNGGERQAGTARM
jgi:hypothetical protein